MFKIYNKLTLLNKLLLVIILVLTLCSSTQTIKKVNATPIYGKKYLPSIGNTTIWLKYSTGVGYWENFIKNASRNWEYTGYANPIYVSYVSSNYGSMMDFHQRANSYFSNSGTLADTRFYTWSGVQINPAATNWSYAEININEYEFKKPTFTNDQALGTIIHEMGHAFGLAHYNSNPYSIMCQTGAGRIVQRVQETDNIALNKLYGFQ